MSSSRLINEIFLFTLANIAAFLVCKWTLERYAEKTSRSPPPFLKEYLSKKKIKLNKYEETIASEVADPLTLNISWNDIGGLDTIMASLQEIIVLPLCRPDIFNGKSKLLLPPKGILLYGKPGCGKTLVAKAIAKESSCFFINLRISTIMEKWYGESQKLVNAVFTLATKLQPCIIFIDEIDSFLRERATNDHESTAMMKAQFMSLWDGLESETSSKLIIIGATNRPQDIDSAIRRRMPLMFHVDLPDASQREAILRILLRNEPVDPQLNFTSLSQSFPNKSGSEIKEICRLAAMHTVRDYLKDEKLFGPHKTKRRLIKFEDFKKALEEFERSRQLSSFIQSW
ncbi:outer mitochondrial transmembrane helix translocase-like isoform X1 [Zophobas morio]|uniref:outer mitochondrial transmembrane helix translocase-like isoform X1 n=1 Tax=Zophobas morio TaxID=2755281 RepID=UPI0030838EB3